MSIFDTIKTDIGEAVKWVEDEAVAVWGYFKAAVTAFSGSELKMIECCVGTVIGDVQIGDLAALETAVLNEAGRVFSDAENAAVNFLSTIESITLQPILAMIAGKLGWGSATPPAS